MIQRRAARYACNRYHNISSVTEMVGHLGWEPLATRRRNMRLCMMYKIAHTVVGDPWAEWLTTAKRLTREFHAWKYVPIYSQHNIYKFSFIPRTIIDWNRPYHPHSVVCDQHTANVNIDLLFEYNSNIDKFDIYSSVKPALMTHIFYFKNAHKRNCYECLLEKVVFIHNGN